MNSAGKWIRPREIAGEPFRIFFLLATGAALLGVMLWPLYFHGFVSFYPGQVHARIMTHCFFGGFVIGFLGTALPRLLSVKPLSVPFLLLILAIYLCMLGFYLFGSPFGGDIALLVLLTLLIATFFQRFLHRKDSPPPGFILVALGFASLFCGTVISILSARLEVPFFFQTLQHLLSFQGFVLLPIMGVGAFILPRFFGVDSAHALPESRAFTPAWRHKALIAGAAGGAILLSFALEAWGWLRVGSSLRFIAAGLYFLKEARVLAGVRKNVFSKTLFLGLLLILTGFLATALVLVNRVALSHFTFAGGFALVTLCVATRVVFGHTGNLKLLSVRSKTFVVAVAFILLGMLTRVVADFWPEMIASHYTYGAISWAIGLILWACLVLRKIFQKDSEE
jgi:uncharacterized protein involved in response to NO